MAEGTDSTRTVGFAGTLYTPLLVFVKSGVKVKK